MLRTLMVWLGPIRELKGGQFRDSVISTHTFVELYRYLTYYDNMREHDYDYIRVSTEYSLLPVTPDSIMLFCNRT